MADDLPLDLSDEMQASLRKLDGGEDPSPVSREILLELADHLQCAARREQLVEGPAGPVNDEQIWKRVLHRFGDPARVAWRLWWDANWEKLMSQRITNILLAVLIVACLGLAFLTLRSMALHRVAIEQARAESMRAQAQAEQMLLTLKEQAENSRKAAAPSEWNQVAFELRYDSPTGDLVEGASVTIAGISPNTKSIPRQELKSGPDGLADFGKVLFGEYALQVKLPNEAVLVRKIGVRPGKEFRETIVCPRQVTKPVSISIEDLPLPAELAIPDDVQKRVWYGLRLRQDRTPQIDDLINADQPRDSNDTRPAVLLDKWCAPLPKSKGINPNAFTLFRRPDGTWVYPEKALEVAPELRSDDTRFLSWKAEPNAFFPIGDQIAARVGEPISVPLGHYSFDEVETYLEVEQQDGEKCLARIPSRIDQPQGAVFAPSLFSSQITFGRFEFTFPDVSAEMLEIYRTQRPENLSVSPQNEIGTYALRPYPESRLSLSVRSKLPVGKCLAQVIVFMTEAEVMGDWSQVDLFFGKNRNPNNEPNQRVPVVAKAARSKGGPNTFAHQLLLVALTPEQMNDFQEDTTPVARPVEKLPAESTETDTRAGN